VKLSALLWFDYMTRLWYFIIINQCVIIIPIAEAQWNQQGHEWYLEPRHVGHFHCVEWQSKNVMYLISRGSLCVSFLYRFHWRNPAFPFVFTMFGASRSRNHGMCLWLHAEGYQLVYGIFAHSVVYRVCEKNCSYCSKQSSPSLRKCPCGG